MARAAVLVPLLLTACHRGAVTLTPPVPAPELVAIDVFGTRQITRAQLLAAQGQPLRELFAASLGEGDTTAQKQAILAVIHELGDFGYVELSTIGYFNPEGMKYYLTVDLVDRVDAARRVPFLPAPAGTYEDPEGLLADWTAYQAKFFELMRTRQISPMRTDCPAFHCLGDHAHLALEPLADKFIARDAGPRR